MALHQSTLGHSAASYQGLLIAVLIVVAVVAAMLIVTAIFGVRLAGPSYDIVPDPAGLAFP